jgi:hypothetical protein
MIRVEKLRFALLKDVTALYERGFDPLMRARQLPALAEFAIPWNNLAPTPIDLSEPNFYGRVIAEILDAAIQETSRATQLFPQSTTVNEGLIALFGINDPDPRISIRRGQAGPLLGYPDGNEGLRKAKRDGQPLIDLIVEEIVEQLLMLGASASYVNYAGSYTESRSPAQTPLEQVMLKNDLPYGMQSTKVAQLSTILLKELYLICLGGLHSTRKSSDLQVLHGLALHALGTTVDSSDTDSKAIEQILSWAATEADNRSGHEVVGGDKETRRSEHRIIMNRLNALCLYLDLDKEHSGKPLCERHALAISLMGLDKSLQQFYPEMRSLLGKVRDCLLMLATEIDYWDTNSEGSPDLELLIHWHER